jgi:hypothetical protein
MSLQRGPALCFVVERCRVGGHEIHLARLARQTCKLLSDPEGRHHTSFSKKIVASGCGTACLDGHASFALKAGDKPGDPEVEEPYSLEEVFGWLGTSPNVLITFLKSPAAGSPSVLPPREIDSMALLAQVVHRVYCSYAILTCDRLRGVHVIQGRSRSDTTLLRDR